MSLNMAENAWLNFSDYARILNMPPYSCNNITFIVSNGIALKFLSVQFAHPGALLWFYLFLRHEFKHNSNESY